MSNQSVQSWILLFCWHMCCVRHLMRKLIRQHLGKIIWLACGLGILVGSVLVEATGDPVMEMLFPEMDKLVHFCVFGLMAYMCISLLHAMDWVDAFFLPVQTIVFVGVVGMLTELIQSHTPTRTADLNDLMADLAGAVVFVLLWYGVKKRSQAYP